MSACVAAAVFLAGIVLRVWFMESYRPAFMGFADSQTYVQAAATDLFFSALRPAGYVLFLRGAHLFSAHLSYTIALQHAVGVATALILFALMRRLGAGRLVALLPAAVVLLDGHQVFLEHAVMSDTLFGFLVVLTLYCAVRARPSGDAVSWVWTTAAGFAAGVSTTVRPNGLAMIVVLAGWLGLNGGPMRARFARAAPMLLAAILVVAAYVGAQAHQTGVWGINRASGWDLYARSAEFADCSRFHPPRGTRRLCQRSPQATRGGSDFYLFNPASPARRLFGGPPHANSRVGAFARAAIIYQPLDYVRNVSEDFARFAFPDSFVRPDGGLTPPALIDYLQDRRDEAVALPWIARYYDTHGYLRRHAHALSAYADRAHIAGRPLAVLVLLLGLVGLMPPGVMRRGAVLCGCSALVLVLFAVATVHYEIRYAVPSYGPLVAAAALSVAGSFRRLRGTRTGLGA